MSVRRIAVRTHVCVVLACGLFLLPTAAKELVVSESDTPLLSDCAEGSAVLTKLAQGQQVRLRFALAGSSSRCYSVSVLVDGRELNGYVARDSLSGLDEFEQTRRQASSSRVVDTAIKMIGLPTSGATSGTTSAPADSPQQQAVLLRAAAELKADNPSEAERILAQGAVPLDHPTAALMRAKALMQLSRPGEARAVIEPALQRHPDNPLLLAMAGLSSFQLDDIRAAEAYLKRSLEIQQDPVVSRVYARVQREAKADKSTDKTYGSRFLLRYEGENFPTDVARNLTREFEREMNRISFQLGCQFADRLVVIIQSRENYRDTTGAAHWSGGQYDGRIRIALPPSGEVDSYVRKTFAHETVHACLARTGRWPSWLHEGLAQKLSGEQLNPYHRELLRTLAREDKLPTLSSLAGSWARLNGAQAQVAYSLALAATDVFFDVHREYGVRNLMNNPQRLPEIAADLDRRLPQYLQ